MVRTRVIAGLLLAGVTFQSYAAARYVETLATPIDDNFALVVSGGISMGSYQGGLVWALLAAARAPAAKPTGTPATPTLTWPAQTLSTFTGASAGNVNALLGAASWCDSEFPKKPEESLMWEMWTRTGIEQLFQRYASHDLTYADLRAGSTEMETLPPDQPAFPGLFHRHFFDDPRNLRALYPPGNDVAQTYAKTHYEVMSDALRRNVRPECHVSIGVTASAVPAFEHQVPSTNIKIKAQRYAILMELRAVGDRLEFAPLSSVRKRVEEEREIRDRLGRHGSLPRAEPNMATPLRSALNAAAASSAFPFAFAPQALDLCTYADDTERMRTCERHREHAKRMVFVDGGVFDNKPLPLAIDIGDLTDNAAKRVIYVDQDRRRPLRDKNLGKADAGLFGTAGVFGLLGSGLEAARQYELFAAGRYLLSRGTNTIDVTLTDRFAHAASEHLYAFGGFLGTPFRQYDFYAGIYDGLLFYARTFVCPKNPGIAQCELEAFKQLVGRLSLSIDSAAYAVIARLCTAEHEADCPLDSPAEPVEPDLQRQFVLAVAQAAEDLRLAKAENVCPGLAPANGRIGLTTLDRGLYEFAVIDGFVCLARRTKELIERDDGVKGWAAKYVRVRGAPLTGDRVPWDTIGRCLVGKKLNATVQPCDADKRPSLAATLSPPSGADERVYRNPVLIDHVFAALLSDPQQTLRDFQQRLLLQAWAIEEYIPSAGGETLIDLVSFLVAIGNRSDGLAVGGFGLINRTPPYVPRGKAGKFGWWVASLSPSHIVFNMVNGGAEIAYEPGVFLTDNRRHRAHLSLLPLVYDENERQGVWGMGVGYRYFTDKPVLSGLALNGQYLTEYSGASSGVYSIEGAAYLVADILRIGGRVTVGDTDGWSGTESWSVTFGISDPGGLAYWGVRLWN